jgi:hypothetical protein
VAVASEQVQSIVAREVHLSEGSAEKIEAETVTISEGGAVVKSQPTR